jgi:cysteine desulfurase
MTEDYIYLDYAASTPVDPRVWDRMRECSEETCANPSSTHAAGRLSNEIIAKAATQVAGLLNVDPKTLVWTSGATESDNLAIAGGARYRAHRGRHIVTMRTEHKAVTDVFDKLAKEGFEVTWVEPGPNGVLDPSAFLAALRDDTQFVSIMFVNNETGVIQDIEALGKICRQRDILFHVDAAQAVGKVPIDLGRLPIDLMSLTGHKFYGPKGIGALYIADRPGSHVEPILFGGGQQRRLRPGTLPAELITGLGMTAEIAAGRIDDDLEHLKTLREADVEGESLLLALEPLLVATGSACNSKSQEPSYVLRALGLTDMQAQSAIRFSVGRPTTMAEVEFAAGHYRAAVEKLRELAPEVAA